MKDKSLESKKGGIEEDEDSWWTPKDLNVERLLTFNPQKIEKEGYQELGFLGKGGMGEVYKVWDPELNRSLAMKIIHPELSQRQDVVSRFIEEVQICAQLQHPNIVPIYETGRLEDGRFYFTMKEIKGINLSEAISEVHQEIEADQWGVTSTGWSFRKLIDVFHQCCLAVSYAHSKKVLHRDLKPKNIMLGQYGEVLVVDWGIAKVLSQQNSDLEAEAVITNRSKQDFVETMVGQITGTPAYMSPEQALGDSNNVDARTDIYSLGAILYEILTGRAPYQGSGHEVLEQVLTGPPLSICSNKGPSIPAELIEACEKAMKRERNQRFRTADKLGNVILEWLDGSKKREQALKIVKEALDLENSCQQKREEAKILARKAEEGLKEIPTWKGTEAKIEWWVMAEKAQKLATEADLLDVVQEQKLQAALTHKSDLEEAHLELARRYKRQHKEFERVHDKENTLKTEIKLQEHVSSLSELNSEKKEFLTYLKGRGAISIETDVEDVDIFLEKYEPYHKRLIAKPVAHLGNKPLKEYPLEKGSYRLRLRKKGHVEVLYPFSLERNEHWNCLDPFGALKPIYIPKQEEIGDNECFIPAGWFWAGGDPNNQHALPSRRIWIDDFVIRKFPVTNREYIEFLDDLVRQGREEEAILHAPRIRQGETEGESIYARKTDGSFKIVPDGDGDLWLEDWPIILINWFSSCAYAKWEAEKKNKSYRLLHELEWEKAARGTDGRFFPWGDDYEASFSCMTYSHEKNPLLQPIDSFSIDESVYCVRGMAGNSRDWCLNARFYDWKDIKELHWITKEKAILLSKQELKFAKFRSRRGGYWQAGKIGIRITTRSSIRPTHKDQGLGFRLGYSLPNFPK